MKHLLSLPIFVLFVFLNSVSAQWVQVGADIDGEAASDGFGETLVITPDGNHLAAGAVKNDGNGTYAGHVRIYEKTDGEWIQMGQDIDGDDASDYSGFALDINNAGTIVAIGSYNSEGGHGTKASGHTRIYKYNGQEWKQIGGTINAEEAKDKAGYSVSLNAEGKIVAIGAIENDDNGIGSGHVRVYKLAENAINTWVQQGDDIVGPSEYAKFGSCVALSDYGTVVAVGAPYHDNDEPNSGLVQVYELSNNTWNLRGSSIRGEDDNEQIGHYIEMTADGKKIAFGTERTNKVKVFELNGNLWTQIGNTLSYEDDDEFGHSIALSPEGNHLAISIPGYGTMEEGWGIGKVHVYELNNGQYIQQALPIIGENRNDRFADALSLSDNGQFLAASSMLNSDFASIAGHVRVFENKQETLELPFSKGVSFTQAFEQSSAQKINFNYYNIQDFHNAKKLGADVVRLPINMASMFMENDDYLLDPLFLYLLDKYVDMAEDVGINLIVTNMSVFNWGTDTTIENQLIAIWTQISEHFKDRSELIHFELANEPTLITDEEWGIMQGKLIDLVRSIDPEHTIIVTPSNWGSLHNLSKLPNYADDNLIYNFHFYDPLYFTHQGAAWADLEDLHPMPFPYDANRMSSMPARFVGTWEEQVFNDYANYATVDSIKGLIEYAAKFGKERNVRLWCGEFGADDYYSAPEDRVLWHETVRTCLEEHGISWAIHGFTRSWGVCERGTNRLFDFDLNVPIVQALGLSVPAQSDFVLQPETSEFMIYDDYVAPHISTWVSSSEGESHFYSEESPYEGKFCMYTNDLPIWSFFDFHFSPMKDVSQLVTSNYALDFWVKGDTPGTKFNVRFFDSDSGENDHSWRIVHDVDETLASWDNTWHHVQIPLADFTEQGAWEDEWFDPEGKFDWSAITNFHIQTEYQSFEGMKFWFDNIKIAPMEESQSVNVTFQVDMQNEEVASEGVFLRGDFNDWTNIEPMQNNGTIYYTSIELEPGGEYQYKYVNGDNWENLEEGSCTHTADFVNRFFVATNEDSILEEFCFNSCDLCEGPYHDEFTIAEIQGTSDVSPYIGQSVIIQGEVTHTDGYGCFIQDANAIRSGIFIYNEALAESAIGIGIKVKGTVDEYNGLTEIKDLESSETFDSYYAIEPLVLPQISVNEDYEGVLIIAENVEAISANEFNDWYVKFENEELFLVDNRYTELNFETGKKYNLTGTAEFRYGAFYLCPRTANDIELVSAQSETVKVTFQVDMQNETVLASGVFLRGSFNSWDSNEPLQNDGSIFYKTLEFEAGTEIEYKFVNGDQWEELQEGSCTKTSDFINRFIVIPNENTTLEAVCFNSCDACDPVVGTTVDVTFQVDMQNQEVSSNGVFLKIYLDGPNVKDPFEMEANGNIYSVTVDIIPDLPFDYNFVNGNPSVSGNIEVVEGDCGTNGHREFIVPDEDVILDLVCFESCEACIPNNVSWHGSVISIYPNPVDQILNIDGLRIKKGCYRLLDGMGRVVSEADLFNQSSFHINMENLDRGQYHLLIESEEGLFSTSILKR